MDLHPFPTLATVLAIATVAGLIATRMRQPLIVAFIVVGIAVGPVGTGWVSADSTIELLAEFGISLLLFLVGLRLDLQMIRSTGPVAMVTGLGQVVLTSAIGYLVAIAFGMDSLTAVYIAMALTFSSTIIIVKLLSDKRELDHLHGRIAVGVLIVQDLVVVVVMIVLTAFGQDTGGDLGGGVAAVLLKGAGLLGGMWLLTRYVAPWLLPHIARSQDLLVLFGVSYAASVAALSEWLGFSSEVGAFLAGVSLASTPFRDALGARLASLRDFLLLFFFLGLGAQLEFIGAAEQIIEALVFSALVLIGKPLIIIAIMSVMRYPLRVSVNAGLPLGQISEFSWILAALGLSLGHITNATVSLITVVGLITIAASTYMITYSQQIYERANRWLAALERQPARAGIPCHRELRRHSLRAGTIRRPPGRSTQQRRPRGPRGGLRSPPGEDALRRRASPRCSAAPRTSICWRRCRWSGPDTSSALFRCCRRIWRSCTVFVTTGTGVPSR